jgi:hypothetical protein
VGGGGGRGGGGVVGGGGGGSDGYSPPPPPRLKIGGGGGGGGGGGWPLAGSGRRRASLKRPCRAVSARGLDRRPRHGLCRRAVPARARLPYGPCRAWAGPKSRAPCRAVGLRAAWKSIDSGSPG